MSLDFIVLIVMRYFEAIYRQCIMFDRNDVILNDTERNSVD